jgi:hypothetical protein
MTQAGSSVLKGSQVRLAGPQKIGQAATCAPDGATARIVEQSGGRAVVEIVCDCGRTIRLHCTYADPAGPNASE